MKATDLYIATKDLCDSACRIESLRAGSTTATQLRHFHKFINLASRFVCVLDKAGGGRELHERAMLFANLTGEGSRYDKYRRISHDLLIEELEKAPLHVLHLDSQGTSIDRSGVEKYLGEAESVLWAPYELRDFCLQCMGTLDRKELRYLVDEVDGLFEAENCPLWGAFLLTVSHKAVESNTPAASQYRKLLTTINLSTGAVAAIKDTADDISQVLGVTGEQATSDSLANPEIGENATAETVNEGSDICRSLALSKSGAALARSVFRTVSLAACNGVNNGSALGDATEHGHRPAVSVP